MATNRTQQEPEPNTFIIHSIIKQNGNERHERFMDGDDDNHVTSPKSTNRNNHPSANNNVNNGTYHDSSFSPVEGSSSEIKINQRNDHDDQQRKFKIRYDLHITTNPSEEPKKVVVRCLREVLRRI